MFTKPDDLKRYVRTSYPEVTDRRIDDAHWDMQCSVCKIVRGFQIIRREVAGQWTRQYGGGTAFAEDFTAPKTYCFRCPVCSTFKVWIVYELEFKRADGTYEKRYFRVTSIPGEGLEDIEELPAEPPALRTAYRQAIRAMDANAHIAAAAMFRRAVQIITRNMLGCRPSNLANELREAVGKTYNGVTVTETFADVGYIIKEAGNQGAHPDKDPDLLDFTAQDAQDLQKIFMELVSALFVVPEAARKAKDSFLARRKIPPVRAEARRPSAASDSSPPASADGRAKTKAAPGEKARP
jgi:uncharacterized protein DUF4145